MTVAKKYCSPRLDPMAFPLLLPHFSCLGNEVYAGSRQFSTVTSAQSSFLHLCDGTHMLAEAVKLSGIKPAAVAELAVWLLWWPEAVEEFPSTEGHIERLILCSRPEDCWAGMGGRIVQEAASIPSIVISCFSPFTQSRYPALFSTPAEVQFACRDEAGLAARLGGTRHTMWSIPENSSEQSPEAVNGLLREGILNAIEQFKPMEVFVPSAMSNSADARTLLNATLALMAEGYIQGSLHIYEDSPAALGYRQTDEFCTLFEGTYLSPDEYFTDITAENIKKASLLETFLCRMTGRERHQWSQSYERSRLLSGYDAGAVVERFWDVQIDI